MKNLTLSAITIERQDKSRLQLPAAEVVPKLILVEEAKVVMQGTVEMHVPARYRVDFTGVDLETDRRLPFIVSREIFDALPPLSVEFVTPDYSTATYNGLNIPHILRSFIAKPGFSASDRATIGIPFNNQ